MSHRVLRVLNVAEKNDASKRIAALLSNGHSRTRNGASVYNKNYQFQYRLWNADAQMTFTSVSGHLLNYDFNDDCKKWSSVDPVVLFEAPLKRTCITSMTDVKTNLEREAVNHTVLIIWTDCDREGENIGFEVIEVCKRLNPRLDVYRAKFSEMTPAAITRAINNLVQPDKRVNDAVDVRMQLDLRIGAAFTRFQTLRLQRKFPSKLSGHIVSYGSCQFPTLGFVVERYKAIMSFIPEDFWKITVAHVVDGKRVDFAWARVRLFNELACQTLFEKCQASPLATILSLKIKPKSKWRPIAMDTIELEKLASRKLRINAKETMRIAESLYTRGIISYPRTETNIFPGGLDLRPLIQRHTNDRNWGDFAQRLLQQGPNPRNGKKSDQAHPPIHPTKHELALTGNDLQIYTLIVRHFLACCSKDAIGQETTVEIDIAEERFIANGLTVIERNYLEVYPYDKWTDKELPPFTQGQTFVPTVLQMNQSQTTPPNLLTEADLITLMDKHGIGTDATHADHIETIKQRRYIGVEDSGNLVPGQLGIGLVDGYDAMGIAMSKPHLRANLEEDLKRICNGQKRPDDVLNEQIASYRDVFVRVSQQVEKMDEAVNQYLTQPINP